jgi:hypothetical protein
MPNAVLLRAQCHKPAFGLLAARDSNVVCSAGGVGAVDLEALVLEVSCAERRTVMTNPP